MDVIATLDKLGVEGRVQGEEFVARCPMHESRTGRPDNRPSWSINTRNGMFNCFSCGYRGSLLSLVRDLNGDVQDIEQARDWVVRPGLPKAVTLPDLTVAFTGPDVIDESVLGRFEAPPQWALDARKVTASACAHYGVLWDVGSESWILPIRDPYTRGLMGWQQKSQTSRSFMNYPTGVKKSRTLFGFHVFDQERMIVVESPLDAVRLLSEGITGAVAVYGAMVSTRQLSLMSAADEVIFALDNPRLDDAGKKSSMELLKSTRGILRSVRFFNYSRTQAKDPGDMTLSEIKEGLQAAKSRTYGTGAFI
jgi:hypothetical protein